MDGGCVAWSDGGWPQSAPVCIHPDHSRLLTGYRFTRHEDTVRLEAALRDGLAARGIPTSVYLDNGAAMV